MLYFFKFGCICVFVCAIMAHIWKSQYSFMESVISFYHMGFGIKLRPLDLVASTIFFWVILQVLIFSLRFVVGLIAISRICFSFCGHHAESPWRHQPGFPWPSSSSFSFHPSVFRFPSPPYFPSSPFSFLHWGFWFPLLSLRSLEFTSCLSSF